MITGAIMHWPTATPPSGFLTCDGSAVSRTTYSDLYAVLADTFGNGDGSTTFNLPDLRGQFCRFTDGGAGVDPDRASRTDRGDTTTGDNVGTLQATEIKAHTHNYTFQYIASPFVTNPQGGLNTSTDNSYYDGGSESRPKNIAFLGVIKY